ncbi:MAG: hypothetical protein O7D86_06925 [Proteobacteria bacterium]|nr:hypothetical protein [Pseudomonadota bacterium]
MQLTIRMPDEYLPKIEKIAKRMGLKKSDITRMAIKKFIAEYNAQGEDKPYTKAQHLLGVAESGITDLGQDHRSYLTERIINNR